MMSRPIDWANEHVRDADATSLRHMRDFAIAGINRFRSIRAEYARWPGGRIRYEWDISEGAELIDDCIAQRMIEHELARRGLEP